MRKIVCSLIAVLCMLSIAVGVSAQQQLNISEVKNQLEMVGQLACAQIGLNADQQKDIKTISDTLGQDCKAVLNSSDSDEAKITKIQALVDKAIPQALSSFTDQQKSNAIMLGVSLLTMQKAGPGYSIDGSELAKMLCMTGLSYDKAAAIIDVLRVHTDSARAIYNDQSASSDAKASKIKALRLNTLLQVSSKLDASEQKVMAAILKAGEANCKTFVSCLNQDQKTKANIFGNQFLRFVEEMVTITK